MDKEASEKLSILIMQINAKLDESIAFVKDHETESDYIKYRTTVGKLMGSLYLDIEKQIWDKYPDLKPKQMDGPYIVDDSIYEPRFYINNTDKNT